MSKSFEAYLPEDRTHNTSRVQGWVSKDLVNEINRIRRARKLQWNDVIGACLKKFRDDELPKVALPKVRSESNDHDRNLRLF